MVKYLIVTQNIPPSGMGSGDRLDTWFECLDKGLGSVIHDVVSEVTD